MAMYETQHHKADIDRMHLQIFEEGGGLIGIDDCVQGEVNRLEKYLST